MTWYDHFFPIAPTSVVFGIGAARTEPVVKDWKIAVARLRKCSLMVDNFVISGLTAAQLDTYNLTFDSLVAKPNTFLMSGSGRCVVRLGQTMITHQLSRPLATLLLGVT